MKGIATFPSGEGIAYGVLLRQTFKSGAKSLFKSGILRTALTRTGNYTLGKGSYKQAIKLGKEWVGKGYRVASDGKTLVSKNGLRSFRPPTYKPKLGKTQANFEWRSQPRGRWDSNGHFTIID